MSMGSTPRMSLPTKPKAVETDPSQYLLLVYGREKIGKTTFFASFPEAVFFFCEPGGKGLPVYSMGDKNCLEDWAEFKAGVKVLQENPGKFRTVVVDTVDRAYDMCLDWVCKQLGIPHPGEDSSGRQDYGKSWRAVKQEFLSEIYKVVKSGRGVGFTSHAKDEAATTRSGSTFTRIYPSMSNQARSVIEALVDFYFYAEYMTGREGEIRRVLVTQGDELIWAGHRKIGGSGSGLPRFLPLTEEGGYNLLHRAFKGEDVGISPLELMPATSSEAVSSFVRKSVREAEAKPRRIVKKKKRSG
jgi:hypothetical protein